MNNSTFELKRTLVIPYPLEKVFAFFDRPENLAKITPSNLHFKIKTPQPIEMKKGAIIEYTIGLNGIPMRWRSLISQYDPPHSFVDEQLKGPYAYWHHLHTFESVEGGTKVTDHVHYRVPFGPLGKLLHCYMIKKQLKEIFDYRVEVIETYFPSKR